MVLGKGGERTGAGRKKGSGRSPYLMGKVVTVRLPAWKVMALEKLPVKKSLAIENAITEHYSLKREPMALDISAWLTHRMSSLSKKTYIPWVSLMAQMGADYEKSDEDQEDFKKAFLEEFNNVIAKIYPTIKFAVTNSALVLYPTPIKTGKKKP